MEMPETSDADDRRSGPAGLTGRQRKRLRSLAHGMQSVVRLGQDGLSEGVVKEADRALNGHELIKVKFIEFKDRKKELSQELAQRTGSECIGLIGHNGIFYRPHEDPRLRRIEKNLAAES